MKVIANLHRQLTSIDKTSNTLNIFYIPHYLDTESTDIVYSNKMSCLITLFLPHRECFCYIRVSTVPPVSVSEPHGLISTERDCFNTVRVCHQTSRIFFFKLARAATMLAGHVSALGGDAILVAESCKVSSTSLSMIPQWLQAMQHNQCHIQYLMPKWLQLSHYWHSTILLKDKCNEYFNIKMSDRHCR